MKRSASLLLLRRPEDPEVYWVRRHDGDRFLSGFWAFPGGLAEGGETPRAAAVRETWEETGYQHPDAASLVEAGTWVTPPYLGRKLETRFYFAWAEEADPVVVEGNPELSAGAWIRPRDALARWQAGEALLAPPTLSLLQALADGAAADPARFSTDPHARGEAPRFSTVRPHITLFPVRTPTLPPATHTNCYIVGTDRLAVIEPASPFPGEQKRLDAYIDARCANGARVEVVLLTHHHRDHIGGARQLADRFGVPLLAHASTANRIPFAVDGLLAAGDRVELGEHALDVHFTPGHAPGHVIFVDAATRSAIVGDMVAGLGTILIEPGDGDMALYLESLERMRGLGLSCLMPSHGPVLGGADHTLARYIRHRLLREEKVVAALTDGPLKVGGIVKRAYADAPLMARMGPGGGIAGLSVRSHLHKLEVEGRVCADGKRWRLA